MLIEVGYMEVTNEELAFAYHSTNDAFLREEIANLLFLKNEGLCRHIVKKFGTSHIDYEDMVAVARFGMLKALRTFDVKKANFATYAGHVMANEIRMLFRKEKKHKDLVYLDAPIARDESTGAELTRLDALVDRQYTTVSSLEGNDFVRDVLEASKHILSPNEYICFINTLSDEPLLQKELAGLLQVSQSIVSRYTLKAKQKMRNFVTTRDFSPESKYTRGADNRAV